jgi:transposase-like protein
MAKTRAPYTPEFRRQMVELVHAGRSPQELARKFEPTAQSIRNWVRLRASAHARSRRTPACRRARGRQGRALRGAPSGGPSLTAAARDGRASVRAGMEEWLRGGRTKEWNETGEGMKVTAANDGMER